jgi:DNA topoisomerase VI subunit B
MKAALQRQTFQASRLLEYFSEKELTLQTGHEPARWPDVILKELLDNALDACEAHDISPDIGVTVTDDAIEVHDNGPGLPAEVVRGVLDFSVRVSSKDAYISPTRGAQGNALKTILAIPYVLNGGRPTPIEISSFGLCHRITVGLDRIVQAPELQLTSAASTVKTGTRVSVGLGTLKKAVRAGFVPLVEGYSLFNPHATIAFTNGTRTHAFMRSTDTWTKWRPSDPTSPHWYTVEQFRSLIAAYVHAERLGGPTLFVRDFVAEFRGLSSTVKRRAVLEGLPFAGKPLHDLVEHGDLNVRLVRILLKRMQQASTPVAPSALGVLGERHLCAWLERYGGKLHTFKYKRFAESDDDSGLPFVVEVAFAGRQDDHPRRLLTGINFAPTLADPFRMFEDQGIGLEGLLQSLHIDVGDPITVVVHLTSPHLRFTDRGKARRSRSYEHRRGDRHWRDCRHQGLDDGQEEGDPRCRAWGSRGPAVLASLWERGLHQSDCVSRDEDRV